MRRFNVVLILTAAVSLLAATAATAGSRDLAGVNTIIAPTPGYVDVRLPSAVTLDWSVDPATHPNYRVSGGGRLAGVMLKQLGVANEAKAIVAIAGQFDPSFYCASCGSPARILPNGVLNATTTNSGGTLQSTLPPGEYRLYAFGDKGPIRATLTLRELVGERQWTPTDPNPIRLQGLPRRDPGANQVAVFGAVDRLATPGVLFSNALAYFKAKASIFAQSCTYKGTANHPLAFFPTCPAEEGEEPYPGPVIQNSVVDANPAASFFYTITAVSAAGDYGFGGHIESAAAIDSIGWAAAWIPFGDPPSVDEPAPPAPPSGDRQDQLRSVERHAPLPATESPPARTSKRTTTGGRLTLASRRLRVRGSRVAVTIRCRGSAVCRGHVALGRSSAPVRLRANSQRRVTLRVPRRSRDQLRRSPAVRSFLTVIDVHTKPVRVRVTLTRAN